jgi:hypothetical protein
MRTVIILALQALLLYNITSTQHVGSHCKTDLNCDSWLTCSKMKCSTCAKESTTCTKNTTICCEGLICEPIPGIKSSHCVSNNNNCIRDSDCPHELKCLRRLGKCGYCHNDGEACTLPYDNLECCSSYCGVDSDGDTFCADPNPEEDPPIKSKTRKSRKSCSKTSDCGDKNCVDNRCLRCQRLYTFCSKSSDCCSNICTASHDHTTIIVAGVVRKICVASFYE